MKKAKERFKKKRGKNQQKHTKKNSQIYHTHIPHHTYIKADLPFFYDLIFVLEIFVRFK